MWFYFKVLVLSLFTCTALAKEPIRIAVIDTGINPSLKIPLCPGLSKDFSGHNTLEDNIDHGNVVSTLIHVFAHDSNYCQIILKIFDKTDLKTDKHGDLVYEHGFQNMIKAVAYANKLKIQVINLSVGGPGSDKEEYKIYESLLDKNVYIINAAGNDSTDLDKECSWFPGCYDKRIVLVGNLGLDKKPHPTSNYGQRVNAWIIGTNIKINNDTYTGTSFSAAMLSGAMVKLLDEQRK